MTCATNGCKYGVFRDHLCAPCYHRAEQQREDLIRRKAAAFDALVQHAAIDPSYRGVMTGHHSRWILIRSAFANGIRWEVECAAPKGLARSRGATLLDAVEAMEECG